MDRGISWGFSSLGLGGFLFPTADVGLYRLILPSKITTELCHPLVRISCVGYDLNLFLINLLWALSPLQFSPLFFSSDFLSPIFCFSAGALCPPPSSGTVPHSDFVLWVFPRERGNVSCIPPACSLSPWFLHLSGHRMHIQFIRLQQLHNKFMASSCCLGIWSDRSSGFWAVWEGSYRTRGRFVKVEAAEFAGKETQNVQYGVTFTWN